MENNNNQTETKYKVLFELSRDAIMMLAPPDWKFTSGNDSAIKMFGAKDEAEFTSVEPWKVSPEYQPDGQLSSIKAKKMIEKAMEEGSNFFEWQHKKINGDEFPATVLLSKINIGENYLLQATVRDITKQKEAEEKLKKYTLELENSKKATLNILEDLDEEKKMIEEKVKERTRELGHERDKIEKIIQSIGDGVFVVDTNGKIMVFNQAASKISGFTTKEVLGKKYDKVLQFVLEKDEKANDMFIKETMITGKVKKMSNHTLLIKKNGSKVPVSDSAAPLKNKNGDITGSVIVFRDVTKERAIDRAKTEFVSLASHQLRTPLSTINWYAEMLLEDDLGKIKEGQRKYLKKIYRNNQRMVELVEALLNTSRIDLGTLTIESRPVNLIEISDNVIDDLSQEIKHKSLEIEKKYEKNIPVINTDPKFIRIIFQNLISNAVTYTPRHGRIRISARGGSASGGKKQDSNVLIEVSDTGYGIPKNQQSKIFTKLFRADNAQEINTDGTGLGLYITKAVVERLGGTIWFESKENKGSIFYVSLPLKEVTQKEDIKNLT